MTNYFQKKKKEKRKSHLVLGWLVCQQLLLDKVEIPQLPWGVFQLAGQQQACDGNILFSHTKEEKEKEEKKRKEKW